MLLLKKKTFPIIPAYSEVNSATSQNVIFCGFSRALCSQPFPNDNVIVWKNFFDERHFCNFHFWHANEVECHSSNNSLLSSASLLRRRIEESIKMPSLCTSTKFVWAALRKKKKENDSSAHIFFSSLSLIKLVVKRSFIRYLHVRHCLGLVYKSGYSTR